MWRKAAAASLTVMGSGEALIFGYQCSFACAVSPSCGGWPSSVAKGPRANVTLRSCAMAPVAAGTKRFRCQATDERQRPNARWERPHLTLGAQRAVGAGPPPLTLMEGSSWIP